METITMLFIEHGSIKSLEIEIKEESKSMYYFKEKDPITFSEQLRKVEMNRFYLNPLNIYVIFCKNIDKDKYIKLLRIALGDMASVVRNFSDKKKE